MFLEVMRNLRVMARRYWLRLTYLIIAAGIVVLGTATVVQMAPAPNSLDPDPGGLRKIQVR